ncbi:MAG TPA: choice-of-anchor J domain-containing protein, partial [Candidatus Cloacimonadota bacterium]|nr:choice-of-anchor J domain-containing protein [Candidatus Cloacimonadota bacterium]
PNLLVGTVDALDGTGTFNELASIPMTTTHTVYTVSFADYLGTDTNICFKHGAGGTYRSIYIDDVYMEELVDTDMSVVALTGTGYTFQNTPVTHTVTVKNNGTEPVSNYTVYLKSVDGRAILGQETFTDPLAADATNAVEITWTPTSPGTIDIYGEVYVADDAEAGNNTSEPMSFAVLREGSLVEGFEGGVIPANWTVLNADGGAQVWASVAENPRTGNRAAKVRWESSSLANDDWLITPPLQVTSATTDNISFWMRSGGTYFVEPWQVLISTTDTNPASFTMIDSGTTNLGAYLQKSYNLDSYGDAILYLAVRYTGLDQLSFFLDDFIGPPIYEPASLGTPEVAISTVGTNVELNWTAIPYATAYEVMAADAPEGPYTLAATVTAPSYSTAATTKKFFKVIAKAGETRSIAPQPLSLEQQLLQDEMEREKRSRN